ncbi:MAG: hypothetical protein ACRDRW_07700 [Pseudonocardiaceae bacterium]
MIGGRILDTSALEHFATGCSVYARALVWAAVEQSNVLVIPTTALTTAWARIPAQDHPVLEVLLGLPNTVVEVLDPPTAHEVGLLLAAADGRGDLAAAHVVWCWRRRGWAILTADPGPLRKLDPEVEIEELP